MSYGQNASNSLGQKVCPQCQRVSAPDAPAGLCAKCLLQLGFDSLPAGSKNTQSYNVPFVAPLPEHIAPHFPNLKIVERIGHGGMGVVYRAEQVPLGRTIALKILRPDLVQDQAFADRFQREAQLLGKLQHPNIVNIFDFGQAHDLFYLIMEYVEGANLRQIQQADELGPVAALALVPQICNALEYAHANGVVHRDIKPENILVNTAGQVKIADFGLAKMGGRTEETALTQLGQVMGTPHYMAPEQVERPADVDHRADIYSLGVVIYEMLTGELPLGRFSAPSQRSEVDGRLDSVVLRALEKQPEMRYQHVTDVRTDIEGAQRGRRRKPASHGASTSRKGWLPKFLPTGWFQEQGISWCSNTMKWFAYADLFLAAIFCLAILFDDDPIPFFVLSLFSGSVGLITSKLLRHREYPYLAIFGSLLLLPPVPFIFPRMISGLWALILAVKHRHLFQSPSWRESATRNDFQRIRMFVTRPLGRIRDLLGYFLPFLRRGAGAAAQSVAGSLPVAVDRSGRGLSRIFKWASMLLLGPRLQSLFVTSVLAGVYSVVCILSSLGLQEGWARQYGPTRIVATDSSASHVNNPFGFKDFGLQAHGDEVHANPWVNKYDEFFYDRIVLTAKGSEQTDSSSQLRATHLTIHNEPAIGFKASSTAPTWTNSGWRVDFPTTEAITKWLGLAAKEQGNTELDLESVATQQAIASLSQTIQTVLSEPVPAYYHEDSPQAGRPVAAHIDHQAFTIDLKKTSRYSRMSTHDYAINETHMLTVILPLSCWLIGILGLGPFCLSAFKRNTEDRSERLRKLVIGISFSMAALCSLAAIAILGWQQFIHNQLEFLSLEIDSENFFWFLQPETLKSLAICQLGLSGLAFAYLGLTVARYFPVLNFVPSWPFASSIVILSFATSLWLVAQSPWLHYWPLLVPMWLALLALPVILIAERWMRPVATEASIESIDSMDLPRQPEILA